MQLTAVLFLSYDKHMTYGSEIKKLRLSTGQTQATMASLAQLSRWQWNRIEKGREINPNLHTIVRMISAFKSFIPISNELRRRLISLTKFGEVNDQYLDLLGNSYEPISSSRNIKSTLKKPVDREWGKYTIPFEIKIDSKVFGDEIKKARINSGQTQKKLAKIAKISVSHWNRLEKGRNAPNLDTVLRMIMALKTFIQISPEQKLYLLMLSGYGSTKDTYINSMELVIADPPHTIDNSNEDSKSGSYYNEIKNLIDKMYSDKSLDKSYRQYQFEKLDQYLVEKSNAE